MIGLVTFDGDQAKKSAIQNKYMYKQYNTRLFKRGHFDINYIRENSVIKRGQSLKRAFLCSYKYLFTGSSTSLNKKK